MTKCAAALVSLFLTIAGCGHYPPTATSPTPTPAITVTTTPVEATGIGQKYNTVGTVRSAVQTTVQSKAIGHITSVLVKEGDEVQMEQPLAELDNREAEAQVTKMEQALNEAAQAAREIENSAQAAESARTSAQAQLTLAKATFDRYKKLAENQAVSKQILDEAEATLRSATGELNRTAETANSFNAKKAEASARIEQMRADLENARILRTHTRITAPFSGLITGKHIDIGDLASPATPLFEMEDNHHYRLETTIDEAHIGLIQKGDKAPVTLDALGMEPLEGSVVEIAPLADPGSRSFLVKVDLPERKELRSGMFGRITFTAGEKQALTIPREAVFERGQLTAVYVAGKDNVARLRIITTGKAYGNRLEVLSGLQEGESVITTGIDTVQDGSPITAAPSSN